MDVNVPWLDVAEKQRGGKTVCLTVISIGSDTITISKSRNCDVMYGWDVPQDESEDSLESLYALFALLRHCEIETDTTMESYLEGLIKLVKAFRIITNAEEAMF